MTAYGTEFFSMNDVNRLRILQDVIDRRLTTRLAATRLEISDRHCRRLLERYREHGPLSLVNRRRGQRGNRQLIPGLAERALRKKIGDGKQYASSRDFAAATGLVTRQYSTRGRTTLLGISKRGNTKIRTLLVQCARVFIQREQKVIKDEEDRLRKLLLEKETKSAIKDMKTVLGTRLVKIVWRIPSCRLISRMIPRRLRRRAVPINRAYRARGTMPNVPVACCINVIILNFLLYHMDITFLLIEINYYKSDLCSFYTNS